MTGSSVHAGHSDRAVRTSTKALTNATLPYVLKIANNGFPKVAKMSDEILKGINILHGKIVYKQVAEAFDLPFSNIDDIL